MRESFEQLLRDVDAAYAAGLIDRAEAARRVARHVHAEMGSTRAGVWAIDGEPGARVMHGLATYDERAGGFVDDGVQLHERDHPAYFGAMASVGLHACGDTFADPVTASMVAPYFGPKGIHATMDVCFSLNAHMLGLLCCEHAAPRAWQPHESATMRQLSSLIALQRARFELAGGTAHWLDPRPAAA